MNKNFLDRSDSYKKIKNKKQKKVELGGEFDGKRDGRWSRGKKTLNLPLGVKNMMLGGFVGYSKGKII